jgi:Tfp pilus assembly protein FimV
MNRMDRIRSELEKELREIDATIEAQLAKRAQLEAALAALGATIPRAPNPLARTAVTPPGPQPSMAHAARTARRSWRSSTLRLPSPRLPSARGSRRRPSLRPSARW